MMRTFNFRAGKEKKKKIVLITMTRDMGICRNLYNLASQGSSSRFPVFDSLFLTCCNLHVDFFKKKSKVVKMVKERGLDA